MKQETGRLKEILHVLNQHNVTHGINPEKLCSILEDLGPTYVKAWADHVNAFGYIAREVLS